MEEMLLSALIVVAFVTGTAVWLIDSGSKCNRECNQGRNCTCKKRE